MNRLISGTVLFALLVNPASAQSQGNPPAPAVKQKTARSFTERLLKFLGISASPSTFKGPGDEVVTGDVWLADLESKTTRALTILGGYRSPIFLSGSNDILALRGTDVMRIASGGGDGKKLYSVDGIAKLVGCSSEDRNQAVVLLRGETDGRPRVGVLTISTGATIAMPYDVSSSQDRQMVESLQGWTRTYGDRELYVDGQSKEAFSGTVEWTDVFLKLGNAKPFDVSQCDGTNCGQPSLSENKRLVVFVKSGDK